MSASQGKRRHLGNLEAFIIRARRVEEHSLLKDRAFVLEVAEGTMRVELDNEQATLRRVVPTDEEQVESATARVRPMVVKDPANGLQTIKALRFLLQGIDETKVDKGRIDAQLTSLEDKWKGFDSWKAPNHDAYRIITGNAGNDEDAVATHHDLAWGWVYGDVVHADAKRLEKTSQFGVRERYAAGSILVCQIIVAAINTLDLIRALVKHGLIPELSEDVFESDVVVGSKPFELPISQSFVGPVGAPLPTSTTDPIDDQFVSIIGGRDESATE